MWNKVNMLKKGDVFLGVTGKIGRHIGADKRKGVKNMRSFIPRS